MKQTFAVVFLFVLTSSCNETVGRTEADSADTLVVANKDVQDSIALPVAKADTSASVVVSDPVAEAELTVMFTRFYCGGARPTNEMVAELQRPKALSKSTIVLKNHFSGKSYSVTTDAKGKAQLVLDAGKYDVYLTSKINPELNTGFQPDCKLWLEKPMITIKLTPGQKTLTTTINFECNPCNTNKPM